MKKHSYFNPEVHSLIIHNSMGWCGGFCAVALRRYYDGETISCKDKKYSFTPNGDAILAPSLLTEILNAQIAIVGKDCSKGSQWKQTMKAIQIITLRIDIGNSPTLLYLDQVANNLVKDHFVIAYAIEDISPDIKHIYTYDPNYVFTRCFCNNPSNYLEGDGIWHNPNDGAKLLYNTGTPRIKKLNYGTYLSVDYKTKEVKKANEGVVIEGFQAYDNSARLCHQKDIKHSCDIRCLSTKHHSSLIDGKAVSSYRIEVSKSGDITADMKLVLDPTITLYEKGDNLYTSELFVHFGSPHPKDHTKHIGSIYGPGDHLKVYNFFLAYGSTTPALVPIKVQSNFVEKQISLNRGNTPVIKTFTAYANGASRDVKSENGILRIGGRDVFRVYGLKMKNVKEWEMISSTDNGPFPGNHISIHKPLNQIGAASGKHDILFSQLYLGYIKDEVIVELTQNGLYGNADVIMSSSHLAPTVTKKFNNDAVTFTLPKGTPGQYRDNVFKKYTFYTQGTGGFGGFTETKKAYLEPRCLIVCDPFMSNSKLVLNGLIKIFLEVIPLPSEWLHPTFRKLWQNKYKEEFEGVRGIDDSQFEIVFKKQCRKEIRKEINNYKNKKQVSKDLRNAFKDVKKYRNKMRSAIIIKSNNLREYRAYNKLLNKQLKLMFAEKLSYTESFNDIISNTLTRDWGIMTSPDNIGPDGRKKMK